MKLLTVTSGPTWPGNAPLPDVGTGVGTVIFRPVARVASGTGTTIGESIARLVVTAQGTIGLVGTDYVPFQLWGGVPADGSVEAPVYEVEEYLHLYVGTPQERAAVQYFRIQPYETVGNGIPEGTWDYRTVPETAVRYVAGPDVFQAFEEIKGGRVILADAEAARLALLDGATGLAALTAELQPALEEVYGAAAAAMTTAGAIIWKSGDHTTLPTTPGDYVIRAGTLEDGQLWRVAAGTDPVRLASAEAVSSPQLAAAIQSATTTLNTNITTATAPLSTRLAAVEAGQSGGLIGYATLSALNADLAHPAGTVGVVLNDPTAANNGEYLKSGASGAGAWAPASTSRITAVEARATTLEGRATSLEAKAATIPPTNVAGELVAGSLPGSLFTKTQVTLLALTPTSTQFRGTAYGAGRQSVAASNLEITGITFPVDTAPTQAFKDASPTATIYLINTTTGVTLYTMTLTYAAWSPALIAGLFTVNFPARLIPVTHGYRVALQFSAQGSGFRCLPPGSGEIGGASTVSGQAVSAWGWTYTGIALAYTLQTTTAALQTSAYERVENNLRVVLGSAVTNVLPEIGVAGVAAYPTAGHKAWGWKVTPPAGTIHAVEFYPVGTITQPGSVQLRKGDQSQILATSYDISPADWNAAAAAGKTLNALFQTPLTVDGSTLLMVVFHANSELIGYQTATGATSTPKITLERWYYPGGSAGFTPTTALINVGSYQAAYFRLLNSPGSTLKRFASVDETLFSGDSAVTRLLGVPDILLPRKLYVLKRANEQFSLYHANILTGRWHTLGLTDYETNPYNGYGQHLQECWRVEPATQGLALGTFTLSTYLRDYTWATVKTVTTTVTVLDPAAKTTAATYLSIGDLQTARAYYQQRVAALTNMTPVGVRRQAAANISHAGISGWTLDMMMARAGQADGTDSPFVFPTGLTGVQYRGNAAKWKAVVNNSNPSTFADDAAAARESTNTANPYVYSAATGYPLNPQTGWRIYDPTLAAGSRWQLWDGAAWVADATQSYVWAFDYGKYPSRNAWAHPTAPSVVSLYYASNEWVGALSDIAQASFDVWLNQYDAAIASIRAASPTVPIGILLPILAGDQDAAGAAFASAQSAARARRNLQQATRALLTKFDTAGYEAQGVYVVQYGGGIDPYNGFAFSPTVDAAAVKVAPNKYQTDSNFAVFRQIDLVHAAKIGGFQGGDWVAAWVQQVRP